MIPLKRKQKSLVVRDPSEERKAELKAILEKLSVRRSSQAIKIDKEKKRGFDIILQKRENVRSKREPADHVNSNINTAKKQFATFEEAVSFFRTEQKMSKGQAIRKVAKEYVTLHEGYLERLRHGTSMHL